MTIQELLLYALHLFGSTPLSPFVRQGYALKFAYASYWTDVFGAPDDSTHLSIYINSFIQDYLIRYVAVLSVLDCQAQEQSFYFYYLLQRITVHYDHDKGPWSGVFEYGYVFGMTDKGVVYVDDICYEPLLKSVPSLAQQLDLSDYGKQAMMTGSSIMRNTGGRLDFLITQQLYGNTVQISYLEDGKRDYTRSEIIPLQQFYIDNYSISLDEVVLDLQDPRAANEVNICSDTYTKETYPDLSDDDIGKEIPLAYGPIRSSPAICTNKMNPADDVEYRQALVLSLLGDVKVKRDDVWNSVTPTSIDLTTGSFTLSDADGRSNGQPLECIVTDSRGIDIDSLADIIVDLNRRYAGVQFIASNYDLTEWAAGAALIESGGWLFNTAIPLYDAIGIIQRSANVGFLYEINNGIRTIRVDDEDRASVDRVCREDIKEQLSLPVSFDKNRIAGSVNVKYMKNFTDNTFATEKNDTYKSSVVEKYRDAGMKSITIETALSSSEAAAGRAEWSAQRYSNDNGTVVLTVRKRSLLWLRRLDCLDIEITPAMMDADTGAVLDGRPYFGVWKCQVIAIAPDTKMGYNKISGRLIREIAET
jgi:hypothetical protein